MYVVIVVKIGSIEYSQDEGNIIARSFFLGTLFGFPLGILANYFSGVPFLPTAPLSGFIEWTLMFSFLFMRVLVVPLMLSIILAVFLGKKRKASGLNYIGKVLWVGLTFFIILPLYAIITYCAVDALMGGTLARISYTLFTLIATPFVILFLAVLIPDSRPGRVLRRLFRKSEK